MDGGENLAEKDFTKKNRVYILCISAKGGGGILALKKRKVFENL